MAETPTQDCFQWASASTCGAACNDPVGGSVTETTTWLSVRPGTRVSPAKAMTEYDCNTEMRYWDNIQPPTKGTQGDVVFTLKKVDSTTASITVSGMRYDKFTWDGNSKPMTSSLFATFDAGDTENLEPISISA